MSPSLNPFRAKELATGRIGIHLRDFEIFRGRGNFISPTNLHRTTAGITSFVHLSNPQLQLLRGSSRAKVLEILRMPYKTLLSDFLPKNGAGKKSLG